MINKVPTVAPNTTPHTPHSTFTGFSQGTTSYSLCVCVCVCACVCVVGGLVNTETMSVVMNRSHFPNQTSEMLGSKPGGEIKTAAREGRKAEGVELVRVKNGKTRQHKTTKMPRALPDVCNFFGF